MFAQGESDENLSYWDVSSVDGTVKQYTFEGLSLERAHAPETPQTGQERVFLGSGDDVFYGTSASDYVKSGGGSDKIFAGAGDDKIYVQSAEGVEAPETIMVTVDYVNGRNQFLFDGELVSNYDLEVGKTYIFDQSHVSNFGHTMNFATAPDGFHSPNGHSTLYHDTKQFGEFAGEPGFQRELTVDENTQNLFFFCEAHDGMGGALGIS